MMGSGGMIVMDESTCMVDVAKYFMNFLRTSRAESVPPAVRGPNGCTKFWWRLPKDGNDGAHRSLEELGWVTAEASLCQLGGTAPNPVLSTLRYFKDEYKSTLSTSGVLPKSADSFSTTRSFRMSARPAARVSRPVRRGPSGRETEDEKRGGDPVQDRCREMHQVRNVFRDLQI